RSLLPLVSCLLVPNNLLSQLLSLNEGEAQDISSATLNLHTLGNATICDCPKIGSVKIMSKGKILRKKNENEFISVTVID
ncbi:MAG: hypothetical protein WBC06_18445, partial [Chitinophagaceae bacterium]